MMNLRYLNTAFFFIILGLVSWAAYFLFAPFVSAIFLAAILAILFFPMYEWMVEKFGGRTQLAATAMVGVIVLTIVVPVAGVSTMVLSEVAGVVQNFSVGPDTVTMLQEKVEQIGVYVPALADMTTISQDTFSNIAQRTGGFFVTVAQKTYAGVVGSVLGVFVLLFTLFYLFVDGRMLAQKLMFLSPLSDRHERLLFESFSTMSRATIKGTIIIGAIQGSLATLALWVVGMHGIMLWWVVLVFVAIIPMLGVSIVGFPVAIYYLVVGDVSSAIVLFAAYTFLSFLDNYLRPLIVGRDVQMHTLLVFFATLGGIIAFGIIGFIVGPIIMALFVTLWKIYGLEFQNQLEEYNQSENGL